MFTNTKMEMGVCQLVHDDAIKVKFDESDQKYIHDSFLERTLSTYIADADRRIKRARDRLEEERPDELPENSPEVRQVVLEIIRLTAEAEAAGEEGEIDKAQELLQQVEALEIQKAATISRLAEEKKMLLQRAGVADVNEKLRVCDICGSFLSIYDSDKRLAVQRMHNIKVFSLL